MSKKLPFVSSYGGKCGIRTHGRVTVVYFQDRCNNPSLPTRLILVVRERFELSTPCKHRSRSDTPREGCLHVSMVVVAVIETASLLYQSKILTVELYPIEGSYKTSQSSLEISLISFLVEGIPSAYTI